MNQQQQRQQIKNKQPSCVKKTLSNILFFPTPDPYLNIGLTSFLIYWALYLATNLEYISYLISVIYMVIYLILLIWVKPSIEKH